jgi:hypothetical protein
VRPAKADERAEFNAIFAPKKRSIVMKTLGSILAVALIGSFIASAPTMARELGYQKHHAKTKRVLVNRENRWDQTLPHGGYISF